MTKPTVDSDCVAVCPLTLRREALLHLAAVHEPALQPALNAALRSAKQPAWDGLWVYQQQGRITGALWVQPLAHTTAQLWLPRRGGPVGQALLAAARAWVTEQGVTLCHVVLPPSHYVWETTLLAHSMIRLAELHHLTINLLSVTLAPELACIELGTLSPTPIRLEAFSKLNAAAQTSLLDSISQGSLDCPALRESLSSEALLAGFYNQAPEAPHHWYSVNLGNERVGVLLLAPGPEHCWELLLMGVVPQWRGQGIGRKVLQAAFKRAVSQGATEMILTVDANNTPALCLYLQAGLSRYAEQRLFAWRG
ncbi:GNAT family N-acetyltransferase [Vreelandella nanhaiensis]|uniref:GNAT family N-acetyltransferase n=1 Tax=Vreelandella nanhaiensis TaxID=1258546 RepID=A0A433KND9_9GAMM|nr:GNAT family N-acetyltransferase [Halomonas nanhaiensis]RUR31136.1 GNAT family N-acetyltransferase [Halomonas nanhaiensis]